jgi:peptide/nickel transport system ATP-binding protein
VKACDDVTFTLKQGERFALVGESGSGKTTLAMGLMRLTRPPGHIAKGSATLNGRDLTTLSDEEMRKTRLSELALVPQGAMNSLNPVMRIERQIIDGILDHLGDDDESPTKDELDETVRDLLTRVGLRPGVARLFPHELSGGMKQRVAMAIGISLRPRLIVADEPTSALDVVVQRQIMQTLGRLQEGLDASIMLVGHDMGLVAQFADTIGVMYAGKLVEVGPVEEVFSDPKHPYTKLLIRSLPSLQEKREFLGIPGLPPQLIDLPVGCAFADRCPSRFEKCNEVTPQTQDLGGRRETACHLYGDEAKS